MANSWDEMRKAKEESYFDKKNREALERLAAKKAEPVRLSPVTGEPMEQVVMLGVVIDRCKTTGGIWLDAGELEQLVQAMKEQDQAKPEAGKSWFADFVKGISGAK